MPLKKTHTKKAAKSTLLVLLLGCLAASSALHAVELTVLYWSDLHSRNLPDIIKSNGREIEIGGVARLATAVNSLRSQGTRTLAFDTGDQFFGTPVSTLTKGKSQIEILNRIGIDAFVPGNHEFDYGWQSLLEVTSAADFEVVLANVYIDAAGNRLFKPHIVLHRDGIDIAVIGLIYQGFTSSVIREGVLGLSAIDPVEEAKVFVNTFKDSVDILIALTHIGWEGDSTLASEVQGLDLIIGGHTHIPLEKPRVVNGALIVQSGPYGHMLGRITVDVDTNSGKITRYDGELIRLESGIFEPDPAVSKFVRKLEKKHTKHLNREIGRLAIDWNLPWGGQSNLAQWTADAMHEIASKANLAVINNGNLRKELKRGPILERDIWEICPFENSIVVFQINGSELIDIVNRQLANPREFLTWSGLKLLAVDGRVQSLTIGGYPVTRYDEFSVISTGYLWDQFESYLGIPQSANARPHFYLPGNQREILIEAVKKQKVISKPLDDRWTVE